VTDSGRHSFLVVSDIHAPADGLLFGSVDPLECLRTALALVDASGYRPEALVFSGDVAHGGEATAYQRVKAEVTAAAQRWNSSVMYVPGNHDHHPDVFRAELLADGAWSADQVLWLGGLRLIGLDSSEPGHEYGRLTDDQLYWLRTELAAPAPNGTILILHHQPIGTPEPIVDSLALKDPIKLREAIIASDVRMVISGHSHHASGGSLDGRPVWICPSLSFTTDVLSSTAHRYLSGGAFTRVDVFDDSVLATLVPLTRVEASLFEMPFDEVYQLLGASEQAAVDGTAAPIRF
jgi:3',5'-cyclic-AMP phosphodiesterase